MATTKFIYWTWDQRMQEYINTDNIQYNTYSEADDQGLNSGRE